MAQFKSALAFMFAITPRPNIPPRMARAWLVVISLVALVLRFARLSYPPALTDEAFTYWRTCGSFAQMLDTLRYDGFVPLHYQLVWISTRVFGHGEAALRLPAAIAGVSMPLAIYLAGRVIFNRRVGLIAAAIATSSAFFSFHQHDAKMYAPAWCAMTFSVGLLLAYFKTGRRLSLLMAIFAGVFAGGCYAPAIVPVLVSPILAILLSPRHRWRRVFMSVIAVLVISSGPIVYYKWINRWFDTAGGISNTTDGKSAQRDNGLMWVDR